MLIASWRTDEHSEIIHLTSYENNERLGSNSLSDHNDHWDFNSSKIRPTCVFIAFKLGH